jgi:hypothetical protein
MAIEETDLDVPLERVLQHIVGDLPHSIACRRSAKIAKWNDALTELIATVRKGNLKVSGRRDGNARSKTVRPNDFAEIADNPVADFSFDNEWSGKRVLEFSAEDGAKILESHLIGAPKVLWTDVCADSGMEVLKNWPAPSLLPTDGKPQPPNIKRILEEKVAQERAQYDTTLSQTDAIQFALDEGATETHREIVAVLESIQGPQKRGPHGKRRGRAKLNQPVTKQ